MRIETLIWLLACSFMGFILAIYTIVQGNANMGILIEWVTSNVGIIGAVQLEKVKAK